MLHPRAEGSGGADGIVLNLTLSGDGIWEAVYSVKVLVGKNQQPLMLSVDTGSSDIWLASKSCTTSACSGAHTALYDPSSSTASAQTLDIDYLRGSVSGPIVWDSFTIGPYVIPSQALAAAHQVSNESLSSDFAGLIGLALPPNSKIAQQIPATESDQPDGATLQMNLFGLTPESAAPAHRFISMSLERPGSSRIPSLLGIGRHPSGLVPGFDPSNISYADLIPSRAGDTFWRVAVQDITAWVDGSPRPVHLSKSVAQPTSPHPVALLDSGGSSILANADIANGIYGAWGIGPGEDGNYYVPCTTPMNLSFSFDNLPPIALHPLDITALPPASKEYATTSTTCLGMIQALPSDTPLEYSDIVLGVPFLRNVYAVFSSSSSDNVRLSVAGSPKPRLGLLPITDPARAMSEFHQVRVLGKPLDPSNPSSNERPPITVGKRLSVGLTILVCIIGFFVACGLLFSTRWWIMRRKFKRKEKTRQVQMEWTQNTKGVVDENALQVEPWTGGKDGLTYSDISSGTSTRVEQNDGSAVVKDDSTRGKRSSRRSSFGTEPSFPHGLQDAASPESDGWTPLHVRTASEMESGNAAASAVPLLAESEDGPLWDATSPHQRTSSAGSVSFAEYSGMAGVGARISAVGSSRSSRSRPRGARPHSNGSSQSMSSRTWRAEVGEILEPAVHPKG